MRGGYISERRGNMISLVPRNDGISNTLTTVLKDNLYVGKVEKMAVEDYLFKAKDGEQYGVFKLTPRECGRLMGVTDADIDKMFSVNSNSQCYKQFGNSIVVPVLMAIFSQLNISGVKPWNKQTEAERQEMIKKNMDFLKE